MNGGRCSTTRIWRPPSSTASWSADGSFASMDPRDELVISSSRTPCQAVPNGSEYLEYVTQNFRNPQIRLMSAASWQTPLSRVSTKESRRCRDPLRCTSAIRISKPRDRVPRQPCRYRLDESLSAVALHSLPFGTLLWPLGRSPRS